MCLKSSENFVFVIYYKNAAGTRRVMWQHQDLLGAFSSYPFWKIDKKKKKMIKFLIRFRGFDRIFEIKEKKKKKGQISAIYRCDGDGMGGKTLPANFLEHKKKKKKKILNFFFYKEKQNIYQRTGQKFEKKKESLLLSRLFCDGMFDSNRQLDFVSIVRNMPNRKREKIVLKIPISLSLSLCPPDKRRKK